MHIMCIWYAFDGQWRSVVASRGQLSCSHTRTRAQPRSLRLSRISPKHVYFSIRNATRLPYLLQNGKLH